MAGTSRIVAGGRFESHWPFVVAALAEGLRDWGEVEVVRAPGHSEETLGVLAGGGEHVARLICLDVAVTSACMEGYPGLREAVFLRAYGGCYLEPYLAAALREAGIRIYEHTSEGFWGQSVAEFALGLTLNALRGLAHGHHGITVGDGEVWARYLPERNTGPGSLGAQFSDDIRFTNGTLAGKRVRVVGAGNIGSRFAAFAHALGADVAAWDPVAAEPAFHRSGARREWFLERLVQDAEIFAPMMPLVPATQGIVNAGHVAALPAGCLVVLVTRAGIVDMQALRSRVLADELALAADVFDVEPLPPGDPLIGRANVVHTPHLAGRTRDANRQWAQDLLRQFLPAGAGQTRADRGLSNSQ